MKNCHVGIENYIARLIFTDSGLAVNHGVLWLSNPELFAAAKDIWNSELKGCG